IVRLQILEPRRLAPILDLDRLGDSFLPEALAIGVEGLDHPEAARVEDGLRLVQIDDLDALPERGRVGERAMHGDAVDEALLGAARQADRTDPGGLLIPASIEHVQVRRLGDVRRTGGYYH